MGLTTLQRWRSQFAGDRDGLDQRKGSPHHVAHRLNEEERQRILLTCNQPEFAALPPGQIEPVLADRDLDIYLEHSFYRVLDTHGQEQSASPTGRKAKSGMELGHHLSPYHHPRQVALTLSGDRRIGRKVVAWDIAQQEAPAIEADLVHRTCLRERISKCCQQTLILPTDNVNTIRAATLESRLEEQGVMRLLSRPRVSNDNPY